MGASVDAQQSPHTTMEPEMQDKTQHGTVCLILRQTCLILGQPVWFWDNLSGYMNWFATNFANFVCTYCNCNSFSQFGISYLCFLGVFVKTMVTTFKWVYNVPNKFDQNVDMPLQFSNCRCVCAIALQFSICKCVWKFSEAFCAHGRIGLYLSSPVVKIYHNPNPVNTWPSKLVAICY